MGQYIDINVPIYSMINGVPLKEESAPKKDIKVWNILLDIYDDNDNRTNKIITRNYY